MSYNDPVVAGSVLVRQAIKSPDYVPGVSGWSINKDGTAEFNNATFRGTVYVQDGLGNYVRIQVNPVTHAAEIEFGTTLSAPVLNDAGKISAYVVGSGGTARQVMQLIGPITEDGSTPGGGWAVLQNMISGFGNNATPPRWPFYQLKLTQPHADGTSTNSLNFIDVNSSHSTFIGNIDAWDPEVVVLSPVDVEEETWKKIATINGWVDPPAGVARPGFYVKRLATRTFMVDGGINNNGALTNSMQIGTLPTAYIPLFSKVWPVTFDRNNSGIMETAHLFLEITTGTIRYFGPNIPAGNNVRLFLSGSYPVGG